MMKNLRQYKYFVFDFDGTICSLEVDWESLRKKIFDAYSGEFFFESRALRHMIQVLSEDRNARRKELIPIIKEHEQNKGAVRFHPIPEALNLIKDLDAFYIISNNLHDTIEICLNKMDLMQKCRMIIGFDDVDRSKPDTQAIGRLYKKTGEDNPSRYVYFGDSNIDSGFARQAGIEFINIKEL